MEITARDFDQKVLQAKKPALVDFWGSWCIPCKQMEPVVEALEDSQLELELFEVNVNRNRGLAAQHRIKGVPTFVLFQDGEERGRVVGAQSPDQLIGFIKEHLA